MERCPRRRQKNYAEYPLTILSQDTKKKSGRVTADENGNYRVALPAGDYVLDVQGRPRKHVRWQPQPFTVVSNQAVPRRYEHRPWLSLTRILSNLWLL
jgi:hypothetical protein